MPGAPEDLVQRPRAEVLPWDGVAEARLAERALRRSLLTITTNDGRRRRYAVLRSTDAYGDPWDPWDAIRHFLAPPFPPPTKRLRTRRPQNRFAGRSPRTVGFRSMTETQPHRSTYDAAAAAPSSYRTSRRWRASRTSGRQRWEADGTYAFDRTKPREPRSTRSTPRRRRCPARCTSATSSPTPTPT